MKHLDFISIDPGVKYFAYACVRKGELVSCGLTQDKRCLYSRFPFPFVIVETQKIHRGGEKKKKAVTDLARAAGEIMGQFPDGVYWPLSQLPKKVFQARAYAALTPPERLLVDIHKKTDQHHILDAIGFAMKYLGRK